MANDQPPPISLRALPGAMAQCALLTALTVTLAALQSWPRVEALLRPLFFALLFSFFHATGRRYPHIRQLPMRLVETAFLLLTLGSTASALMLLLGADLGDVWVAQLRTALDRGAILLLGFVLLAYGLMLWIPQLLEHQRQLAASYARTRDQLQVSESARSRMEQRLVDTHRLGILGELAAGVAHDLRNPLTIVKGAADALRRKARTPDEVAEHAGIICRSVEKADRTIQALIELGRPRTTECKPLLLGEVVHEVLALVQVEARRRGVRLEAQVGDAAVLADRDLLLQVLLNLVLNAAQASPSRGAVTVRARAHGRLADGQVAIAVEDRGPGLPPEVRRQLFTPFFTTRVGGTGLGLLSSRRLVNEMSGRLDLFPRTSGGARALVLLRPGRVPETVALAPIGARQ